MLIALGIIVVILVAATIIHLSRRMSGTAWGMVTILCVGVFAAPYVGLYIASRNYSEVGEYRIDLQRLDGEEEYLAFNTAIQKTRGGSYAVRELVYKSEQQTETIALRPSNADGTHKEDAKFYYSEDGDEAYAIVEEFTPTPYWFTFPARSETYKVYNFVVPEGTIQNSEALEDYLEEGREKSSDDNG